MSEPDFESDVLTEEQVASYLRSHPAFFHQYPALLSELSLPHDSGNAVSLVERQVSILRERNINMRRRMAELVNTARMNDELFGKTRAMTLALLDVTSFEELNEVLATALLLDFAADFVTLHLRGPGPRLDHLTSHEGPLPTDPFCTPTEPSCLSLRPEEVDALFPLQSSGTAGSAVLLPLEGATRPGNLAIGSRDPGRFTRSMDTLFVRYIAEVCARVLNRLLRS